MKKVLTIIASLFLIGGLTACPGPKKTSTSSSSDNTCEDSTYVKAVRFDGTEDTTIEFGKSFDIKGGVALIAVVVEDSKETDINYNPYLKVEVIGATADAAGKVETHLLTVGATFKVKYSMDLTKIFCTNFADGVSFTKERTITVVAQVGEKVYNGSFDELFVGWGTEGTTSVNTASVETVDGNKFMVINAQSNSGKSYQPRLNTDYKNTGYGMFLEKDKNYQLTFKAKAQEERFILVQCGKLTIGAPYFVLANELENEKSSKKFELTKEWETYKMSFRMNEDTNGDEHLTFECGPVDQIFIPGKVYIDDIELHELDGALPDENAPVFSGLGYTRLAIGATFNPLAGVTATDAEEGDVTSSISYQVKTREGVNVAGNAVDTSVTGKFKIEYRATDSLGNVAKVSRRIYVAAEGAQDENFFGTPSNVIEEGSETQAASIYSGQFVYWMGDTQTGVSFTDKLIQHEGGVVTYKYTATMTEPTQFFAAQLFYKANNPEINARESYEVSFDLLPGASGRITINGKVYDLVEGVSQKIQYTVSGSELTLSVQFGESTNAEDGALGTVLPSGTYLFSNFMMH